MIELPFPVSFDRPLVLAPISLVFVFALVWIKRQYAAGSPRIRVLIDLICTRRFRRTVRNNYASLTAEEQEKKAQWMLHSCFVLMIATFWILGMIALAVGFDVIRGKEQLRSNMPVELEKEYLEWRNQ